GPGPAVSLWLGRGKGMDGEGFELDWVHLPSSSATRSLWTCLHDARLESVRSERLERSVTLSFDVWYIRDHHQLPEDLRFRFCLAGVRSVRAVTFVHWPGAGPGRDVLLGKSYEEQTRLVDEYQSKGREESVSWTEFEEAVTPDAFLDLRHAELVTGAR